MQPTAIVYNKQWTTDCLNNLRRERRELEELYRLLSGMKYIFDVKYIGEVNQILQSIQKLETSINATYSAMDKYMYDMDNAIRVIAEKIEIADGIGSKVMKL